MSITWAATRVKEGGAALLLRPSAEVFLYIVVWRSVKQDQLQANGK